MSPVSGSQGVVLATAMAVSGTVILLALRLQKCLPNSQFPADQISQSSPQILRSCIPSEGKKRSKKKKKRVHFAEDVVDPSGDNREFRRQHQIITSSSCSSSSASSPSSVNFNKSQKYSKGSMPANRVALYNGILRDRVASHRLAYSH